MANNSNGSGKYWPYMILGFLFIGLLLGFWTVKSTISMPVNESNAFQKKYQDADMNFNELLEKKQKFDANYNVEAIDFKSSDFKPEIGAHAKSDFVALKNKMSFSYRITDKSGKAVNKAKVSFLLTRPQTRSDDKTFTDIKPNNGVYTTPEMIIGSPGRYVLRFKAQIGDAVGYTEHAAYLKP